MGEMCAPPFRSAPTPRRTREPTSYATAAVMQAIAATGYRLAWKAAGLPPPCNRASPLAMRARPRELHAVAFAA